MYFSSKSVKMYQICGGHAIAKSPIVCPVPPDSLVPFTKSYLNSHHKLQVLLAHLHWTTSKPKHNRKQAERTTAFLADDVTRPEQSKRQNSNLKSNVLGLGCSAKRPISQSIIYTLAFLTRGTNPQPCKSLKSFSFSSEF